MALTHEPPPVVEWTLRDALAPGIAAVRRHWQSFLAIQATAVILVISYYRSEGLQEFAGRLGEVKVRGGVPFSFVVGAIACSVIPEIAKLLTGKLRQIDRPWAGKVAFTAFVYGIVGVQVDLFYRLQAVVFGTGTDPQTFLLKTAVDMLLFSTLLCIPTAVLLFEWRRHRFRWPALKAELSPIFYRNKVLPALIPAWAFWTPVLCCAYAMPVNLQFLFSMLAEAAWSLLFVFIATEHEVS